MVVEGWMEDFYFLSSSKSGSVCWVSGTVDKFGSCRVSDHEKVVKDEDQSTGCRYVITSSDVSKSVLFESDLSIMSVYHVTN